METENRIKQSALHLSRQSVELRDESGLLQSIEQPGMKHSCGCSDRGDDRQVGKWMFSVVCATVCGMVLDTGTISDGYNT